MFGLVFIAPIVSGARFAKFSETLFVSIGVVIVVLVIVVFLCY